MRVAIPLQGFSFCDLVEIIVGAGWEVEVQSPYGAFLFATLPGGAELPAAKGQLQSPDGAFLFCDGKVIRMLVTFKRGVAIP